MKKYFTATLLGTLLFALSAQAQKPVTVKGYINSLPDGTEVIVGDYATYGRLSNWPDETLARCKVKNGKFSMKFTITEPREVVIYVELPHSNKPVVVVPGDKVTINATKEHGFFTADMKAGKQHEAFTKILSLPFGKNNIPEGISREEYMKQLIKENADTYFGPLLVYGWSGYNLGYAEFYNLMPQNVRNTYHGRALKLMVEQELAEKAKLNDPARKAKVAELKHETPKYDNAEDVIESIIAQYKGKTVFVDFWATWCAPCRAAMKTIRPLEGWMADNDIVRIYVSAPSSDKKKWELMIPEIGGNHYFLNQKEWKAIGQRYGFAGIPYYRIYNKIGTCTYEHIGYPGNDKMKEEFEKALQD